MGLHLNAPFFTLTGAGWPAPVNGVSNKYVTINCQMLIGHE